MWRRATKIFVISFIGLSIVSVAGRMMNVGRHRDQTTSFFKEMAAIDRASGTDRLDSGPMRAIWRHHPESVFVYINNGNDVNELGLFDKTALHLAIEYNYDSLALFLIYRGARLDAADIYGATPLTTAAAEGRVAVLRELLRRGARTDYRAGDDGNFHGVVGWTEGSTALHAAADSGQAESARALVKAGANSVAVDSAGFTPLELAAYRGRFECERMLLRGRPASGRLRALELFGAARASDVRVAKRALSNGVHPDLRDRYGQTPLMCAAEAGSIDIAMLLLEAGADIDARDDASRTPLIIASMHGQAGMAQFLETAGANRNTVDAMGWKTDGSNPTLDSALNAGLQEMMRGLTKP